MIRNFWHRQTAPQKITTLFLLSMLFRAFFSLYLGLADDEAYHWSWTHNLQLSYFDHPGMIAWLEALTTSLFGDNKFAIRLPGYFCFLGVVILLYKLAQDLFDDHAAIFVGACVLWMPFWGFGGYIAAPEQPFMFFWVSAAWVFWQGVREDGKQWSAKKTWLWLGILMGLGVNSKFIISLLAIGFGIYLLTTPHRRKVLLTPWPWVGLFIATVISSPIFIWNHLHHWPSFEYQFNTRHASDGIKISRWLIFLGAQVFFYTPFLYALIFISFITSIIKFTEDKWRFLFSLSIPSLVIFYTQPLFADYKPHWSGAACTLLLVGAGGIWSQGLHWGEKQIVAARSKFVTRSIAAFSIPFLIFVYSALLYPWVPKAFKAMAPHSKWRTTNDFSNEFTGWEELGQFVNRRQREIHGETGRKPFLAAQRYETTAQTTWGTKQKVYMLNLTTSHYTVLQTPEEMKNLWGQDAIFVSTEKYYTDPKEWAQWDQCQKEELKTFRHGEHARTFYVFYCTNFQGVLK